MFMEMRVRRNIASNYFDDLSIFHIQGTLNLSGPGASAPSLIQHCMTTDEDNSPVSLTI